MSHNTGIYYSANSIWIVGRSQDKVGTEIQGYHFTINIEKSRMVREKSKIPITVSYDGGIKKFSGLLDMALESGHVVKPSNGWYAKVDQETGEMLGKVRAKETETKEFWDDIIKDPSFDAFLQKKFKIASGSMIQEYQVMEEEDEL